MKLEEKNIAILYSDEHQGEILIHKQVRGNCITAMLDCLCLCRKEGWPLGGIARSFEAVSIRIKREVGL
jgi:hypothetical protein